MGDDHEITRLLRAFHEGDRSAFDRLFGVVYEDLRRRAHYQLRESGGGTLATTALVHEAYLKLVGAGDPDWESRRHFYRVAARAMRQIVVDHARRRRAEKRGGSRRRLDIDRVSIPVHDASEQLVALDGALSKLEEESPGPPVSWNSPTSAVSPLEEAADVFGTSPRTVKRLRQFGRAFLHDELSAAESPDPPTGPEGSEA